MQPFILALADDLTGALEIGAKFAEYDLRAIVVSDLNAYSLNEHEYSALIIDTETRHLSPIEAGVRVRDAAIRALSLGPKLIYKKTDSTLRGNIAAELRALQDLFPLQRLLYAPAYPDMGRTVTNAELFVWGKRVHETEFANDPFNPINDCRVHSILGDVKALVLDGESNADVEAAVHAILSEPPPHVCAGPAALAGALARHLQSGVRTNLHLPKAPRCLVVNGSLHPVSIQQMNWAERHGLFDGRWTGLNEQMEGAGLERAMRAGEHVRQILQHSPIEALIVFGGDTAFGVHYALGAPPFQPLGEIAPGVPVSRSGDMLWVTKAGGFGPPDILRTIQERLR